MFAPYLGYKAKAVKPNSGGWVQTTRRRLIGLSMLNNIGFTFLNKLPVLFFNRPENSMDELKSPHYSYSMTMNFCPADHIEEIRNIAVPTLVVIGSEDESFYAEEFPAVFEAAEEYATVQIIDAIKHLDIVLDEKVVQVVKEWNAGH